MFRDCLESWYGLTLPPLPKEKKRVGYGVHGTEQGRAQKLIPDQVLADLLSLRNSPDITKLDRVMVNAIAVNVACGFRINELLHLPKDCLVEDEGCLYVRNHTSKKGREAPRLVPKPLEGMVRTAIADLQAATKEDAPSPSATLRVALTGMPYWTTHRRAHTMFGNGWPSG